MPSPYNSHLKLNIIPSLDVEIKKEEHYCYKKKTFVEERIEIVGEVKCKFS